MAARGRWIQHLGKEGERGGGEKRWRAPFRPATVGTLEAEMQGCVAIISIVWELICVFVKRSGEYHLSC